ncbi:MAG: M20/M25/M40 family metallo-hydrolase [Asgard group archaeon]|nr:M20/M25/M40 family metallo-hydrolase [Asgard group archaeon]
MNVINKQELIELLRKLISFNTVNIPNENIKSPRDCPNFIVDYLKEKGIKSEIFEDDGYYSVFGKAGKGDFHLLLMAHFDVVPVSDGWETNPFEMAIKDTTAYGRGVIDNKNNVASIMTILPEIKKLDLEKITVCFELSGDEEIGGVHSAGNYMKKFSRMPDAVMNLDGAGEVIISRRRNAMGATLKIPKKKAITKGIKTERKFTSEQHGRHTAYQNRGADIHCMIKASVDVSWDYLKVIDCQGKFIKGNVVPDECTLTVIEPTEDKDIIEHEYDEGLTTLFENLRYIVNTQFPTEFSTYGITIGPNLLFEREDHWELGLDIRAMTQNYEQVENALNEICTELFGEKQFELIFKPGQGMVNTAKDTMLISTVLEVSKEFQLPSKIVEMGGASDARYFSREGIPTFDFGPDGGNVHANNEWLNLESFYKVTNFYLEVVKRILKKIK